MLSSQKNSLPKEENLKHDLYDDVAARKGILELANDRQTNLCDTVVAVINKELQNKTVIDHMKMNELSIATVSLFGFITVLKD